MIFIIDIGYSGFVENKLDITINSLIDKIVSGEYAPGDRIPSEREMSDSTGFSRVTIRGAYKILLNRGILSQIHGSGTYICSQPKGWKTPSNFLAVLATLENPFSLDYFNALEKAAAENGFFLIVKQTHNDPHEEKESAISLYRNGINNMIIWPCSEHCDFDTYHRLRILGCNFVFFDRIDPGIVGDYVNIDTTYAFKKFFESMKPVKEQTIPFFTYSECKWTSITDREHEFMHQCAKNQLKSNIYRVPLPPASELDASSIQEVKKIIFETNHTPIICANDNLAIQIREMFPDIEIYSFDGLKETKKLNIHSIRPNMAKMGQQSVELMKKQWDIKHEWTPQRVSVKGFLL